MILAVTVRKRSLTIRAFIGQIQLHNMLASSLQDLPNSSILCLGVPLRITPVRMSRYITLSTTSLRFFCRRNCGRRHLLINVACQDRHMTSVLGLQDISPKLHPVFCPLWKESTRGLLERVMYGNLSEGEDPYLTINTKLVGVAPTTPSEISRNHNDTRTQSWPTYRLCLYKIKMPADGTRRILIDYIRERASRTAKVGLYAAFGSGPAKELEYQDYELSYKSSERYVASFDMLHEDAENSAMEVGVYCKGIFERSEALPLLRIRRISIKPIPAVVSDSAFTITNIRVVQRGESPNVHKRLIWEWEGPPDAWPTGLPWSKRTGPFSHFVISADCRKLGYAHCLEFPILEEDFEIDQATSGNNVEIGVDGVLFGGGVVNAPRIIVPT